MIPILQLDDDDNDILLLEYAFKAAGVKSSLHSVRDGQQAVDYLAGHGIYADRKTYPMPCLVLLDLKTPILSGFEVLQWIRERPELDSVAVIMFTASANKRDVETAYRLRANSFVVKPAGIDKLADFARALHQYWFGYNHFGMECESHSWVSPKE